MSRFAPLCTLVAVVMSATLAMTGAAFANHLCNGTISVSFSAHVLPHDHNCPAGTAITIDADSVNLDLGGFTVSGMGTADVGINIVGGSDTVVIFNGIVRGFGTGIKAGDCLAASPVNLLFLDDLSVRNSGAFGIDICADTNGVSVANTGVLGVAGTGIQLEGPGVISATFVSNTVTGVRLQPNGATFDSASLLASVVREASGTAVEITTTGQSAHAEVRDGWVRRSGRGISVSGDLTALISGMSITGTELEAIGAHASLGGYPVNIEDTVVRSVGTVSPDFGGAIMIHDRIGGGQIINSSVRDVTGGPGIALVCSTSAFLVEGNVVRDVEGDGILLTDVPTVAGLLCANPNGPNANVLRSNAVAGSGGSGIVVAAGVDQQLYTNAVMRSGVDGFVIGSAATVFQMTGNRSRLNGDDGYQLDTAAITLIDNVARNNTGFGFETNFAGPFLADSGNTATSNTAGDCNDPSDFALGVCP